MSQQPPLLFHGKYARGPEREAACVHNFETLTRLAMGADHLAKAFDAKANLANSDEGQERFRKLAQDQRETAATLGWLAGQSDRLSAFRELLASEAADKQRAARKRQVDPEPDPF